MKVGTENRVELILAVVLGAVALLLVGRWMFSSDTPAPAATSTAAQPAQARGTKVLANTLDPTLRLDLLSATEALTYEGKGRNIFISRAEDIPRPVAPPIRIARKPEPEPIPQGPPPPPPIDLKFFGFASRPGEQPRVFLSQGESVFIAREGDIVNRRYRVLRIGPNAVEIEDVLNSNRQSIPLTQG
ncbi:MAG TPA: hypothetical protein VEG32_03940 [Clostridia bacterium]|nr:hypothetical protein [Clostridia bacterium]